MFVMENRGPGSDPLDALVAFHRGVRAALAAFDDVALLGRLGTVDPLKARALVEFFQGPLRRHDRFERDVLLPALLRVDHPQRVVRLIAASDAEHDQMERVVDAVLAHVQDIAALRADPSGDALTWSAARLRAILEPHMQREEEEIFPLARLLLDPADLVALRDGRAT